MPLKSFHRRFRPVASFAAAAVLLCAPTLASAAETGNLLTNPSFESGGGGWSAWGGNRGVAAVADAPDGAKAASVTGWFLNSQLSLNSSWQPLDGRASAGACTASAAVRMHTPGSRTARLVLRERNGFGMVVHQYASPRTKLSGAFQTLTAAGNFAAGSGNRLDVSVIVDGANLWGGDRFLVDVVSARCTALPPLHVHLGDSYSSGAGAETTPTHNGRVVDASVVERGFLGNNIHPCYRTRNNAAHLIARELGQRVRDWSCSGAKTENILRVKEAGFVPLQIGAVTRETEMVTLTIGGNDAALLNILFCSLTGPECTKQSPQIAQSYSLLEATRAGIRATLQEIVRRAPDAEVYLANYPYLLPLPGTSSGVCGDAVSQQEMQMGKELQDVYGGIVRDVVAEFGAKVRFVDVNAPGSPFNAVDEHGQRDICSVSQNRWMNGVIDLGLNQGIGEIHPNATGYRYYAEMYLRAMGR